MQSTRQQPRSTSSPFKTSALSLGISVEHGSLEKLIRLALSEFDENGCITRPPATTIVLLTMHKWFVTSKEFFAKVVEIYRKHNNLTNGSSPSDDLVFDEGTTYNRGNTDQDSLKLTSISESVESDDEVNKEDIEQVPIPGISINGVVETLASHARISEQKSSGNEEKRGTHVTEIAGNNNETSEHMTTEAGPEFDVAVGEPCIVAHAQPADNIATDVPQVKVMCVKEEEPLHKSQNGSLSRSDEKQSESVDVDELVDVDEPMDVSENDEQHNVNIWVVCQFLHYWMSKFGNELRTSDVIYDISQFKKSLMNENREDEKRIKLLIGRSVLGCGDLSGSSSRLVRQKEMSRSKSLAFKDLSPKDVAEQLTHIDCKSLKKIPISEWKTYARKTKLTDVPNLEKYVVYFNGLSRWIDAMVLNGKTPESRAHIVEKFLSIAECLRNHQNFNSLMAVVGALNHSAVRRLHQTVAVLSVNKKKFLEEMTEFLSSENNYSKYRRELGTCQGFYVPILGVHLKDLIAVDTALPDYVSDKKLINFQKMVKFYSVIATLMNFKNMQPPAPVKFELINMLRLSIQMSISEDELYELSYAKEPRRVSCISNVDKNDRQDSQLFADWASGRVRSPDSKTIDRHVSSMVEAVFKFYDRDSDGLLTTEDFEAITTNFPFVDSFGVVDTDNDGVITKEEMKNYFLKINAQRLGQDFIHNFQETTYLTPNFCDHCGGILWGLIKQGFKCKDCGINCHKACKGQVVIDCRTKTLAPPSPNTNTSTLERAAHKADNIRNKWRTKRRSRSIASAESDTSKTEETGTDVVDSIAVKLEKSDEACKVLLFENKRLKDENDRLKGDLNQANAKIKHLETQLQRVRQETITFVLEQLDALQLRRNTAV